MKSLEPILVSGREVLPVIEGGKGISVSNGQSSGAFAAAGAVGTFSAVNADSFDENGVPIPQIYRGRTRSERFEELVAYAIDGGSAQARIAHDVSGGQGRLLLNTLWEAAGTERILNGVLEKSAELIHGVVCGAGMPYRVAEIASRHKVYYYPIVSSARAFRALWKRSYHKHADFLGGVIYEDPWRAGGHNGLSNSEDHEHPQDPYPRVRDLRNVMRSFGLDQTPVFMAGGVWFLREWEDWIGNQELGPIAFQFGTRPLLTQESPTFKTWKEILFSLKPGDISLNRFSPTDFYSSAVRNSFLRELEERSARQVPYSRKAAGDQSEALAVGAGGRSVYVRPEDKKKADEWIGRGFVKALKTPDSTLIFVTPEKAEEILESQRACMGCLSACTFSSWADNKTKTTGKPADPRSFCIQTTLQDIIHGGDVDNNLLFSGHNAYRFKEDPFYENGFIPTVQQLVSRILTGD